MYGKYFADYREYSNDNIALGAMVESLGGNAYPFRVSEEGEKLRKTVQEWWGEEVNSSPERKRIMLESQDICVQYIRLDIVLPEDNDENHTGNDVNNSVEVLQRVGV